MKPDVVLVTGRQMRKPDPEIHLLVAALEQQSIDVVIRPWDEIDTLGVGATRGDP